MQPLSAIPLITVLLNRTEHLELRKIVYRTVIYLIILLCIVFNLGPTIVLGIGLSSKTFTVIGGVIVILAGFYLLFGKYRKYKGLSKEQFKSFKFNSLDLALVPLIVPLFVDPVVIVYMITYSLNVSFKFTQLHLLISFSIVAIVCCIIVYFSFILYRLLTLEMITMSQKLSGIVFIGMGTEILLNVLKTCKF